MDEHIALVKHRTSTVEVFEPGNAFFINLADLTPATLGGRDFGGVAYPYLLDEDALTIVQEASKDGAAYRIDDLDLVVAH